MKFWSRLVAALTPRPPIPDAAPPLRPGKDRLHLFFGDFASPLAAELYCYGKRDPDEPEPFTKDLPGAFIDTRYLRIVRAPRIRDELLDHFGPGFTEDILFHIGGANTLVLLTEAAFGGLPYSLNNTPRLFYVGHYEIDAT